MSDAPKTIWATGNPTTGSWNHEALNPRIAPIQHEYTLTASVAARLKAADELAEVASAMARMIEDSLRGTGQANVAINPDHSLTLNDAFKRLTAYRKTIPE